MKDGFDATKPNGGFELRKPDEGTRELYTSSGKYIPERMELHARIVAALEGQVPPVADGEAPTVVFMAGGPASGKSTALRSKLLGDVPGKSNAVHSNPDDIMQYLPEYNLIGEAGVSAAIEGRAQFVHEESSDVHSDVVSHALQARKNVVADVVGDNSYEGWRKKIQEARRAGAGRVACNFVMLDTDDAWARSLRREKEEGRRIDEPTVRFLHRGAARNASLAIEDELFDEIKIWDNNVPYADPPNPPILVARKVRGYPVDIYDEKRYDAFIAKGAEAL